jgi:hypothetical protein
MNDLKELERFLKICRKQGVTDITFNGVSVKLGDLPLKNQEQSEEEIPTDELTPEQLMFYAVPNAVGGQ